MRTLRLTWLLRKASDRRAALLGSAAYALVTTLVLLTLAGAWSFLRWQDEIGTMYQLLAAVALVLLVVPLAYLGSAAARLSARAQDRRLSTLRLLGATGFQVASITVLGAAAEAVLGVLAGTGLGTLLAPLVGLIHFRSAPIGAAIWMPWWVVALLGAAVVVIAVVSAITGLRRVLVTPLGVRTRAVRPVPGWVRLLLAVALVIGGMMLSTSADSLSELWGGIAAVLAVLGVFLIGLVALNALGPWVLGVWGRLRARRARDAASLLAARTVLDDAAATWRQVSGAAMAGFVAVVGGAGAALAAMGQDEAGADQEQLVFGADVRTGVIVTLVIAFVGVACTTLVSQAATVLDREELTHALERMGVPERLPGTARVKSLMGPLVSTLLIAVIASGVLLFPLVGAAVVFSPLTCLVVAVVCVAGVFMVRTAAVAASRVAR